MQHEVRWVNGRYECDTCERLGAVAGVVHKGEAFELRIKEEQEVNVNLQSYCNSGPMGVVRTEGIEKRCPACGEPMEWSEEVSDAYCPKCYEKRTSAIIDAFSDAAMKAESNRAMQTPVGGSLDDTLIERGSRYGPFEGHADITQRLKYEMRCTVGWQRLNSSQREALEMVMHKVGRILNGDPNYADSWVDIAGYAQLVVKQLEGDEV